MGMWKPIILSLLITVTFISLAGVSSGARSTSFGNTNNGPSNGETERLPEVSPARLARLRHGINLSHWFSQSPNRDYSQVHLQTHTTAQDIALIEKMGFDHVRFPIEPAPLFNPTDPSVLNAEYLRHLDDALDMILAHHLAVIIDIHPSDDFKLKLNTDDRYVEAFAKFWRSLAQHLAVRDPERVFLEVLNEPTVEDGYRWAGIQTKLIAGIRAVAPRHTIIATGHRWSGLSELLFLEPMADPNVIYNFHFYEPMQFTHQGATWAGPFLPFYKNVPYPSRPEAVAEILDKISDEPARLHLMDYGEERWDASRIETEIAMADAWAQKHHVHLTCNEFGVYRKFAPAPDRAAWLHDVRVALEKHGIGWTMWDYAGGFAVVDKHDNRAVPDAEIVTALGLH